MQRRVWHIVQLQRTATQMMRCDELSVDGAHQVYGSKNVRWDKIWDGVQPFRHKRISRAAHYS